MHFSAAPLVAFRKFWRGALRPRKALCGLTFVFQTTALLAASVSQATFQSALDKLNNGQTTLDLKIHALQTRFEDYIRTNVESGLTQNLTAAQITTVAQTASENFVRSLDLGSKMEVVKDHAVRDSMAGFSNALNGFETNLLNAVRAILATNPPRVTMNSPAVITNSGEAGLGQLMNGLQIVSKQVATLQSTVTGVEARADRLSRRSFYAILASGVALLLTGAASTFFICSRSAALAHLVNDNLDRDVQWFASNVQCVSKAVSDNMEMQRTETAEHLNSLKAHCEAAIGRYEGTLRGLHEQAVEKLCDLNIKVGGVGEEISTALRLYAGELTGNRLEAELDAATVLWKRNFDQTLAQEQTRGMGCLQQLREQADGELRKAFNHQNQQAEMITRECVEHLRGQFRQTLHAEIDSARSLWARQIEEERQGFTRQLGGFIQQQADTLRQSVETTAQSTQKLLEHQLLRFKGQADQTLQGIQRDLLTSHEQLQAIHQSLGAEFERLKERDEAFSDLFWPGCFKHGPLSSWRQQIQAGAIRREPAAVKLLLALGRFNSAGANGSDLRKLAQALHEVSQEAYQFWKITGAKVLDASQEWKAAFQTALDTSKTPLEIMLVLEGERFDMNSMLVADGGSASRIVVRDVLSWIVRDKSGPVTKVVCHGWVTAG